MTSLTTRRLEAIIEALHLRLADEIETGIPREVYERALAWAEETLERRSNKEIT